MGRNVRGTKAEIGDTNVNKNGYHHSFVDDGTGIGVWRLTHHIIAEQNIGRPLEKGERVLFKDIDRFNLEPNNIIIKKVQRNDRERRIKYLVKKYAEIGEELTKLGISVQTLTDVHKGTGTTVG